MNKFGKHTSSIIRAVQAPTSAEALPIVRESLDKERFPPRHRASKSRKAYQRKRVDELRKDRGAIIDQELAKALREKLLPGVKNEQTAVERLEAIQTFKAISLCITTRSIGFGSISVYLAMIDLRNIPVRGTVYQFYRASLAVFEAQMQYCQRGRSMITLSHERYHLYQNSQDFLQLCRSRAIFPDQIARSVNAVGNFKVYDSQYYPRFAANRYREDGSFIPQSEHVTYSNLRATVTSLADPATPLETRRRFYNNNPIPGAIWRNYVLLNPDEIMPENHTIQDLTDDFDDIQAKIDYLAQKRPKFFNEPIKFDIEGSRIQLSCNNQSGMRVRDREEGQALDAYYRDRMRIDGDVDSFENISTLTSAEQLSANLCLLGERPLTTSAMYPIYSNRDIEACVQLCAMSYRATRSIVYAST